MRSLPGWTTEIRTLGCVVDAAGVVFVRRVTDAAVSMKAVCSNCTGWRSRIHLRYKLQ
jgi:hypothetical protein